MSKTCDIAGCDNEAVAKILLDDLHNKPKRCPACLEFDGEENGWW